MFNIFFRKQAILWAMGDAERAQEMAKRQSFKLDKQEKFDKMDKFDKLDDPPVLTKIRSGLGTMIIDSKEGLLHVHEQVIFAQALSLHI